jgi:hypothetical protein
MIVLKLEKERLLSLKTSEWVALALNTTDFLIYFASL